MDSINLFGVLFLVASWGGIIWLNIFCFAKIFKEPQEKIVGPLEVESEIDEHRV